MQNPNRVNQLEALIHASVLLIEAYPQKEGFTFEDIYTIIVKSKFRFCCNGSKGSFKAILSAMSSHYYVPVATPSKSSLQIHFLRVNPGTNPAEYTLQKWLGKIVLGVRRNLPSIEIRKRKLTRTEDRELKSTYKFMRYSKSRTA